MTKCKKCKGVISYSLDDAVNGKANVFTCKNVSKDSIKDKLCLDCYNKKGE